ncbi:TIGR01777 family oxidoreductase [Desulfomicrobium escambiense]|uniref:TIGR01777 family oxidoreductase n=1 Tax=Desulfomicrobium escambiense TaxID=29503 RepID=UPI0004188143|nr:TIGR01777 family oxidoreductase [Desulfomicrobium escambiense]
MKILAFGATGFVGAHLVPHLVERGHEVTVAARSGKARFAPPVVVLKADPTAPGPWQDLVAGFDAVVNLAGTPVTTRWDEAGKKSILESRVLSTRNIVDALSRTAGKTFLCASAVGYYGDGGDKLLTEDAPRGTGFLADVAAAWEAEARRAESFGHRVVMPRISVVLGDGGALAKMHLPFSLGLGGRLGNGKQWFPWIHIRDLVRAMSFLLENPAARGAFNACAPEVVTNAGFTASLARVLKRPAVLPVPPFALRLVMGEAAAMLLSGQRCVPAALQALGFAFEHPNLDRALADIVPALKKG